VVARLSIRSAGVRRVESGETDQPRAEGVGAWTAIVFVVLVFILIVVLFLLFKFNFFNGGPSNTVIT
jgi:hypothetical protein